jgi:hypothetical protein
MTASSLGNGIVAQDVPGFCTGRLRVSKEAPNAEKPGTGIDRHPVMLIE